MNKNDQVVLTIDGYNSEAQGVGRYESMVVFVPFALKGEQVRVSIIKVAKNYAVGKIVEIIKPSKDRIEPKCPHFKKCGGCALQHVSYYRSLEVKHEIVRNALEKIGGFKGIEVCPVVGCHCDYGYRNKSAFPLAIDGERLKLAMYRPLSHDPIFINTCPITKSIMLNAANAFILYVNTHFSGEKTQIRHTMMRFLDEKLLFVVVTMKKLALDGLFEQLCAATKLGRDSIGLFECVKSVDNNVILEGKMLHIDGIKNINSLRLGVDFALSPNSFYQVNDEIMQKIYERALECFSENDIVVDAYSGTGLLSAMLAKKVKRVVGIEIVKEASADANRVKAANHLENLENLNGDVQQILPEVVKGLKEFSLIIDPPRKGVSAQVLKTIGEAGPKKLVYISCNPASLARDLKILCEYDYIIDIVQPYDMFPQTQHVETLVLLHRK